MKELQIAVQTLLVVGVIAGGWSRFMEMIFDLARVIAKRIDRKEVVLTAKEIDELTSENEINKEAHIEFILRLILKRRGIHWKSMSYNKADRRLHYYENYYV